MKRRYQTELRRILDPATLALAGLGLLFAAFILFSPKPTASVSPINHSQVIAQRANPTTTRPNTAATSPQASPSATPATKPAVLAGTVSVTGPGIPILMYHYVGYNPNPKDTKRDILSITPDKLDRQLSYLAAQGYTTIDLDTLYGIFNKATPRPRRPIVLTFDDGYVDFYINAYPLLRKYNFHATEFIPTGLMNQGYYLSWDQIKEMKNSGLVSFQAHSVSHADLPYLPYQQLQKELKDSKQTLELQLGTRVNFLAYPYGAVNKTVILAAAQAGFVGGVGTWYGKASSPSLDLPRIRINGNITLEQFIQKLQ